jgi:signal transduction histidine kinase
VATTSGIRHRLLTIVLLGVLTSALSLVALVRLLSTSTAQRVERAREGVVDEVDRLARDRAQIVELPASGVIGMRGGVWSEDDAALPPDWAAPVASAVRASVESHAASRVDAKLGEATLVVSARPRTAGVGAGGAAGTVWAGFAVRPLPSLRIWQWIVVLLAFATALLVATAIYSVVTVNRGAAALRASLNALADDLSAPIPRPRVRELSDVADGVARLADRLSHARREEERLGHVLAQQERLAALGRVAAGVAHEVRNPLASIKLRLDLAAAGAKLPDVAERAISHASSEIARLDRLVADLLMVAGRAAGPRAPASLGALLMARVDALAPWAAARGVTLEASGDARATIDPDAVARAIDNLLRNAIEASARGATVRARMVREGTTAWLHVDDPGPGVAEDRIPELFEPFFTTKSEGTGLGLAISRAIARAHGGDVVYTRDEGATRFALSIDASPPSSGSTRTHASGTSGASGDSDARGEGRDRGKRGESAA